MAVTNQRKTNVKEDYNPHHGVPLMWQQRVFITWPPIGSLSLFPLVPPSVVLQQNAQSHLRACPPHCPKTREILGKGHVADRRARSCRCETLLVSAWLLDPCGFPAGLSTQSRDWVGPTRPQEQHGPGAQLTSGQQEGREGNESHRRQPVGFHRLTGWTVSISGAATILLVGLPTSKAVVLCY